MDIVLVDQAGVGESEPIPRSAISLDRAIADIEALRQKLGLEKISLVGQSWGGRLGVEYAARHRDHIERMAFVSGAPLSEDPTQWKFDERKPH